MNQLRKLSRFESAAMVLAVMFALSLSASAQNDPVERTFTEPRADIEKAVTAAKASSSGKLPALDGFVGRTEQPVERYEKAYYQCVFQVIPSVSGEMAVRVAAKISAWYDDPDKRNSGYQILPSNGRLENDALDRVQDMLEGSSPDTAKTEQSPARKYNLSLGPVIPHGTAAGTAGGASKDARLPAIKTTSSPATEEEIQELRRKRVAVEKHVQQLNGALQNLQELYESQTAPQDLIAITKTGTPVYAHPEEGGKPLFAANANDQFEMVEIRGEWIHVNISGASRGWIRKSQVQFPDDAAGAKRMLAAGTTKSTELFRVTRDETGIFPGNWEPLHGKSVKVYSVEPAQSPTLETRAGDKRDFARELFLRALEESSSEQSALAGVVVIFDSADGGQASATLPSLKLWRDGKISDAAFWQSCSLDPPETFSLSKKKQ
jgi:hypothetical protein